MGLTLNLMGVIRLNIMGHFYAGLAHTQVDSWKEPCLMPDKIIAQSLNLVLFLVPSQEILVESSLMLVLALQEQAQ